MRARVERWLAPVVIVVVGLLVCWPLWSRAGVVASRYSDVVAQFLSLASLASRARDAGTLPIWNPSMNGGAPALAYPQSNLLFPIDLLFDGLPPARSIGLVFTANVVLAGVTMSVLARRHVRSLGAVLFASLAYMLAWRYLVMIHVGWLPRMSMYALAPLLFFACGEAIASRSRAWTVGFAVVVALCLLHGDSQPTYYAAIACVAYAALAIARLARPLRLQAFACIAIGGALGVVLAAPAWLPAAEYASYSTRRTPSYAFFLDVAPTLADLRTLLDPDTRGGTRAGFWEANFYFGVPVSLLAVAGGVLVWRRARWLVAATLLGVALCFDSPLLRLCFHFVPGFSLFRQSPRVLLLVQLAVVIVAAIGLDELIARTSKRSAAVAISIAALACAAPVVDALARVRPLLQTVPIADLAPRTAMHDALAEVSRRGGRTAALGPDAIAYGMAGWFGIDLVNGYSGLTLQHWVEYLAVLKHGTRDAVPSQPVVWTDLERIARPDLLAALAVERIVSNEPLPRQPDGFDLTARYEGLPIYVFYRGTVDMNVDVYAARAPLGAAWFATRVTRVETGDQSLDALVASRSPADVAVLGLEQDPPIAPADARARLIDRGVDRFVYETDSTRAGFLVLSQIWYPGWTLDVDGAPIEIYRAHHALLGAIVPAGKHVLTLRMTAPALVFGVGFAAIGTLACLAVIGIGRRRTDAARAST